MTTMMAAIVPLLCSTVAPRAAVARWLSHRSAIHNLHCLAATTDRAVDLAERACSVGQIHASWLARRTRSVVIGGDWLALAPPFCLGA